ncbi:MAG: glycoside hydrolase family 2 protein [Muribaculaceae bacterium]|nr:glycoside hydrolase family 2 protein [Muribaculaceae bacterium]
MSIKSYYKFSILLFLLFFSLSGLALVNKQDLGGKWQFKSNRDSKFREATVPGTVHTDLLNLGEIPDPFIEQNERLVQWIDKEDWIYETTFEIDDETFNRENIVLNFEGIDNYGDVWLNDSLILNANNMFREWEVPVKGIVNNGQNKLRVYLHSPIKVDMPKYDALPFHYEAGNDQSENGGLFDKKLSVFARKAGYQYGWDWGPRLVTSGIWRPVSLLSWNGPRIDDLFISTKSIEGKNAKMQAQVSIESAQPYSNGKITILADGNPVAQKTVNLQKGENTITMPFNIKNPKLWWSNGLGEPNLYNFEAKLEINGKEADKVNKKSGVRTIELVREDDKDGDGRSFYFKLNGVPVFAKGANYIPQDSFLPRVTPEQYKKTVQDAADANMNMLRIWGGGIYENDLFYELCDSLGIMVWQDFMFACSLYPTEGELLDNIRQEAIDNVVRLRNHPSIVLWCGNNECLEGWYNWGYKNNYEKMGYADIIWKQYENLYNEVLPEVVAEYAPDMFYTPSSPFSREDGSPERHRGDTHLWTVWGGGAPFDEYDNVRGRFFSEYGFQSFPEYNTVLKYAPDSTQHHIDSNVMMSHQRGGTSANQKIEKYLLEDYNSPKDFKSMLYLSQVLQGDAIKRAIESHRRDKGYNMGTLFWQHNDCWPVASWSSRDYYGNWKAQHYLAKKAYRDVLVSPMVKNDSLNVTLVSDANNRLKGKLVVSSYNLNGNPVKSFSKEITILPQGTSRLSFPLPDVIGDVEKNNVITELQFITGDESYNNVIAYVKPKDLNLHKPDLSISTEEKDGKKVINLKSDNYIKSLYFSLPQEEYFFSDNYFDVIPGKEYSITLESPLPIDEINKKLEWMSVYEASPKPSSTN